MAAGNPWDEEPIMSLAELRDGPLDDAAAFGGQGEVGDYLALLKPRVMSLVVFTALVGTLIAPSGIHPVLALVAILCIAIGAGASGALNMWYDADIDAVMSRTRSRPVPSGRVAPGEALTFGLTLSAFSVGILGLATNWLAAGLLAFTIFFYAVVYECISIKFIIIIRHCIRNYDIPSQRCHFHSRFG